jgi:MFS family permease
MMPAAAAAMFMKVLSASLLRRFGYRRVLTANTVLVACCIAGYSLVGPGAWIGAIVALGLTMGLFNSLQFSSLNTMAYADIEPDAASMASTIASTLQQMSLSFGLAIATLVTSFFLAELPQSDHVAVTRALHHGYLTMATLTLLSSLVFHGLRPNDGESVSKGTAARDPAEPRQSELA